MPTFIKTRCSAFSLLLIVSASIATAEEAAVPTFMWKVSSPGNTVYLLGSIHFATQDFYPMAPEIEDAFAKSKNLVVEANVEGPDAQANVMKLALEKGMYKDGGSLSKSVSKETYGHLKTWAEKNGVPAVGLDTLKPWLLSMQVTSMEMQKLDFKPELGIDVHFLKAAKEKNKPILELESLESQVNMLSGMSDELQDKFLLSTLTETDELKDKIKLLVNAWKTGDAKQIDELLLQEGIKKHPETKPLMEKMFDERNVAMTEKIDGYLKGTVPHFVVVGAGHLVGEKGIVSLLRKKGYKIEQVKTTEKKANP